MRRSVIERAVEKFSKPRAGTAVIPFVPTAGPSPAEPADPRQAAAAAGERDAVAAAASALREEARAVTISADALRKGGMIVPDDGGYAAEQYRTIKRALLAKAAECGGERAARVVMVTSARPGEGKTFTAINLALSTITERETGVVLVDGDVLKPSIPAKLGFDADRGLLDLIADEASDVRSVVLKTNWPKLDILPAGRPHPLAHELVASTRMAEIIDRLLEQFPDRMIIFDAPPLLATTLAGVLAAHVGQVAFVVQALRTGISDVRLALEILSGCKQLGMILNMMPERPGYRHYQKYYSGVATGVN